MLGASGRRHFSVNAFALGLVIGGSVSAVVLLVVGSVFHALLPAMARWVMLALLLAAFVARYLGIVRFAVPENRRLVPETVFRHGSFFAPLQFGIEMGTGARTYVTSNLPYMLALLVLLVADVPAGLAAGVGFGIGRALMTWAATWSPETSAWHEKWARRTGVVAAMLMIVFLVLVVVVGVSG